MLIICMHFLMVIHMQAIYQISITASLFDKDDMYLIKSVVPSLHICKRVLSATVCEGLPLIREDRNDDCFAACLQVLVFLSSVCQVVGHPG